MAGSMLRADDVVGGVYVVEVGICWYLCRFNARGPVFLRRKYKTKADAEGSKQQIVGLLDEYAMLQEKIDRITNPFQVARDKLAARRDEEIFDLRAALAKTSAEMWQKATTLRFVGQLEADQDYFDEDVFDKMVSNAEYAEEYAYMLNDPEFAPLVSRHREVYCKMQAINIEFGELIRESQAEAKRITADESGRQQEIKTELTKIGCYSWGRRLATQV